LKNATPEELYDAIVFEAALHDKLQKGGRPAYREAEVLFRGARVSWGCSALDVSRECSSQGVIQLGKQLFSFPRHPGAYLIRSALCREEQEALTRSILRSWIERPNRRNFDGYLSPDISNKQWATQHGQNAENLIPRKGPHAAVAQASTFPSQLWTAFVENFSRHTPIQCNSTVGSRKDDGGTALKGGEDGVVELDGATAAGQLSKRDDKLKEDGDPRLLALDSLSWCTLGLQYDWTQRAYHLRSDEDYKLHTEGHLEGDSRWEASFPVSLHSLSTALVTWLECALGERALTSGAGGPFTPFLPQAAIINVYRGAAKLKLPMGGHRDDMERTMEKPVVSISLGCPAVFLLGGDSKEDCPTPILLRSGDVFILSGASRKSFHGVPKVFDTEPPPHLFEAFHCYDGREVGVESSNEVPREKPELEGGGGGGGARERGAVNAGLGLSWDFESLKEGKEGSPMEELAFQRFMASTRLNVNIRQVAP